MFLHANGWVSLVLVSQKVHDSNGSLLDDLPFDELQRVPINLQPQQLHKA